jgi:hypothetical protein
MFVLMEYMMVCEGKKNIMISKGSLLDFPLQRSFQVPYFVNDVVMIKRKILLMNTRRANKD